MALVERESRRRCLHSALMAFVLLLLGCRSQPELPHLGEVPSFSLTDQSNATVSEQTLRGKVWIAAFMFTRCPTVCPRITRQMLELQRVANARKMDVTFVSFTVDPEYDTPQVLRKYADEHGADLDTWSFLSGDHDVVERTVVQGFKMTMEGRAQADAAHFGISHGSHFVLIDRKLRIRGYYASSEPTAMKALLLDARRLGAE
jgi:protein SCO1/2